MTDHRAKSRQALIAKFQVIAMERIERLNNALMELEQDPDSAATAALAMREIHTLKGEAKLMGFADVNLVAHKIEDLLLKAQADRFRVSEQLIDFILKGFDVMGYLLHKQAGSAPSSVDLSTFVSHVDALLQEQAPAPAVDREPSAAEDPALPPVTVAREEVSLRVDVKKLDELTYFVGDLLRHQLQTKHALQLFHQIGEQWHLENQQIQSLVAGRDLTGEVSRHQLEALARQARGWLTRCRALQGELFKLVNQARDDAAEGRDLLAGLEDTVKDLRLLPLNSIFNRFPRAVRDLAKEQGKQVRLALRGGELQVDKLVLEKIGEPLLHLIRNSIDHGLETPDKRTTAGKPAEGKVVIAARQAGTHVEIALSDDGRGISPEAVRAAAVSRGLLREAEAEALSHDDLLHLIFRPGLSTQAKTTDISGRGIGLDVVKDGIENLGGSVRVQSAPGSGTTFYLEVPIFVVLMRGLVVEAGQGTYAIPSFAVNGVTSASPDQLEPAGTGVALRLDDGLVPLQDLGQLMGQQETEGTADGNDRVVVIQGQGRRMGLRVRRVLGERELVQRPLDPFVRAVPLLIGTAVHEYAKVAFVLNVSEIMQTSSGVTEAGEASSAGPSLGSRCVLLVEDSELTRDMLEGILRALGHQVVEAANGRAALDRLETLRPDLVITDLEMPVINGFELIEQIRATESVREVPIIVLTTRGSEADRQRAATLGADAYLVKARFKEEEFTETVTRFLRREGGNQ